MISRLTQPEHLLVSPGFEPRIFGTTGRCVNWTEWLATAAVWLGATYISSADYLPTQAVIDRICSDLMQQSRQSAVKALRARGEFPESRGEFHLHKLRAMFSLTNTGYWNLLDRFVYTRWKVCLFDWRRFFKELLVQIEKKLYWIVHLSRNAIKHLASTKLTRVKSRGTLF